MFETQKESINQPESWANRKQSSICMHEMIIGERTEKWKMIKDLGPSSELAHGVGMLLWKSGTVPMDLAEHDPVNGQP